MKVAVVIGARPQFIKAAAVSRSIRELSSGRATPGVLEAIFIHTGQHYDRNMNAVFFEELELPEPHFHLGVGSGTHGGATGRMLAKIEKVLLDLQPDWVMVFGDTNSTLAGALAAAKLQIPIAHVEAGLRSHNRRMPEEINRKLTDHLSQLLFAPTAKAVSNLAQEGIRSGVFQVGDVMLDLYRNHQPLAASRSRILKRLGLTSGGYLIATVHRQENTDSRERLAAILQALEEISRSQTSPVILPLHPRTRKALSAYRLSVSRDAPIKLIDPVGYLDMVQLETHAHLIFTDSGGVQKEAYFSGVPCVTLRDETEWVETVEAGANFLGGARVETILDAYGKACKAVFRRAPGLFGSGNTATKIVDHLLGFSPSSIHAEVKANAG